MYSTPGIAENFLDTLNTSSFNKEDQNAMALLRIQAKDLTDQDITQELSKAEMLISYFKKNKRDKMFLKLAYYYAGRIISENKKAPEAIKYFKYASTIDSKEVPIDHKIYSQMGDLFYDQYLYSDAYKMYQKAYNYAKLAKDSISMSRTLRNKGLVLLDLHQFPSAITCLNQALSIAEATQNSRCINSVKSYLIMAYTDKHDFKMANSLLPDILKDIAPADTSAYYFIAAQVYKHTDKKQAIQIYKYLAKYGDVYAKEDAYSFFTSGSLHSGKITEANQYFNKYQNAIESIRSTTNSDILAMTQAFYDFHSKEKELAKLSEEKNKIKMWSITGTFLFIALLFALSIAIIILRQKADKGKRQLIILKKIQEEQHQSSDKQIMETKTRIHELEHLLLNASLEKDMLRKKLTEEREKLVAQNVMSQIKKKERDEAIEQIRKSDIGLRIHSIATSDVKTHLTQDEKRKLEEEFDQQMPSFKEKLWSIIDLNNRELCVCLLFKLGYKPADMAHLLGCTPSAISKIKVRQYKKIFGTDGRAEDWDAFMKEM